MKRVLLLSFCLIFILCSCQQNPDVPASPAPSSERASERVPDIGTNDSEIEEHSQGTRDNTPLVLVPSADGIETNSCNVATVDVSNSGDGYIMVDYTGKNKKVKLQLTGPDQVTYTYNLSGGYEVFPLTSGSGTYTVGVYENTSGNRYVTALSWAFDAQITNEFGPYLYPNQYVNFNVGSLPIAKAQELAYSANEDLDVVQSVYNFIIENFTYDYERAKNVKSGYLPMIDVVYLENTGICFDYAAIMASMLRSQRIPTRLEVGYVGEEYHAWISIYIEDIGWINGIIEFDGTHWKLLDPTFASTSNNPKSFVTQDSHYLTKYVY